MTPKSKEEIREKWLRGKAEADYYGLSTREARKSIRALLAALDARTKESELLWRALSQTFAIVPPERARLCEGAEWMFENYRARYAEVCGDDA